MKWTTKQKNALKNGIRYAAVPSTRGVARNLVKSAELSKLPGYSAFIGAPLKGRSFASIYNALRRAKGVLA